MNLTVTGDEASLVSFADQQDLPRGSAIARTAAQASPAAPATHRLLTYALTPIADPVGGGGNPRDSCSLRRRGCRSSGLLDSGGRRRPKPRRLLERVARAASTPKSSRWRPTIWMPTGRPSGVKPAGTEIAGRSVARDPVRRLHPGDVVVHRHAVDLLRPVERRVERRHLVHRAEQELVALLEARACARAARRARIIARATSAPRERAPRSISPIASGFIWSRWRSSSGPSSAATREGAHRQEDLVGAAQIRAARPRRCSRASSNVCALRVEHRAHARDRAAARRDPGTTRRARRRSRARAARAKHGRVDRTARRIARIGPGHHAQQQRHVGDRCAPSGPSPRSRGTATAIGADRHEADGRPQARRCC